MRHKMDASVIRCHLIENAKRINIEITDYDIECIFNDDELHTEDVWIDIIGGTLSTRNKNIYLKQLKSNSSPKRFVDILIIPIETKSDVTMIDISNNFDKYRQNRLHELDEIRKKVQSECDDIFKIQRQRTNIDNIRQQLKYMHLRKHEIDIIAQAEYQREKKILDDLTHNIFPRMHDDATIKWEKLVKNDYDELLDGWLNNGATRIGHNHITYKQYTCEARIDIMNAIIMNYLVRRFRSAMFTI